jgi:hypothetical protein
VLFLLKDSPVKKRKFETVGCLDATTSSFVAKVSGEVFSNFHAVTAKRKSSTQIDCLACQDEFFVNNPLDVKGNDEHALDFTRPLSRYF